jgi:hypothetical protein
MADVPPPESGRIRWGAFVGILASTLGLEKSEELVLAAARRLGYSVTDEFRLDQALAILDELAQTSGIVGVVARVAQARGAVSALMESPTQPPSSRVNPSSGKLPAAPRSSPSSTPPSNPRGKPRIASAARVTMRELVEFLTPALGDERAAEEIAVVAKQLGLTGDTFERKAALTILETLASADGTVGNVARFAKARFLLRYPDGAPEKPA